MGNSAFEKVNLKQARRLLSALSDLARESSLTGSLEAGSKVAVRQYNGLLDHLSETGAVPEGLFTHLDEDEDSFDELGVACILLNSYIAEEDTLPAPPPSNNMIIHSDSQELHELRELRGLLRERRAER
jgi:hypothetical protein